MSITAVRGMGRYAPDVFGRLNPVVVRNDTREGSRPVRRVQAVGRISLNFRSVLRDLGLFVWVGCQVRGGVAEDAFASKLTPRRWAVCLAKVNSTQTKKAHLSVSLSR